MRLMCRGYGDEMDITVALTPALIAAVLVAVAVLSVRDNRRRAAQRLTPRSAGHDEPAMTRGD
jgi:hypothetical protein